MPDDRATADAFDLKRLPDAFYDDPYPTYRALREHAPAIAGMIENGLQAMQRTLAPA